jgi:hypothetical protein
LGLLLAATCCGATGGREWLSHTETTFAHAFSTAAPVNAMAQTPDGFLWIGMQDGLVRWDGHHQKVYVPDPTTPGHLPSPDIQSLHVDGKGTLWVSTPAGLARYDRSKDQFDEPFADADLKNGFVHRVTDDKRGQLWIATSNGLVVADPVSLRVTRHSEIAGTAGMPAGFARALLVDSKDRVWVAIGNELYARRSIEGGFVRVALPGANSAAAAKVMFLMEDATGRIWLSTANRSVYVVQQGDAIELQPLSTFSPAAARLIPESGARGICEMQPGEVWLWSEHGIVQVNLQHKTARLVWLRIGTRSLEACRTTTSTPCSATLPVWPGSAWGHQSPIPLWVRMA